jgi:hypothetical protein
MLDLGLLLLASRLVLKPLGQLTPELLGAPERASAGPIQPNSATTLYERLLYMCEMRMRGLSNPN